VQWIDIPQDPKGLRLVDANGARIGQVTGFTPAPEDRGRGYTHIAIYYIPGEVENPEIVHALHAGSIESCMQRLAEFWDSPSTRVTL
jgi:hypothetical protein